MKKMLVGFWDAICGFAKASWSFLTNLFEAAVEFIADVFDTIFDFFDCLFDGIIEALRNGFCKLWVLFFPEQTGPDEDPAATRLKDLLGEAIATTAAKSDHPVVDLNAFRFGVKTDTNNKISSEDDIKIYDTNGSSMGGFDNAVRGNGGIVEVQVGN